MIKKKKEPKITGGIIYEDGTIESNEEIKEREKKAKEKMIKERKSFGDVDTAKIIETEKSFGKVEGLISPPYSILTLTKLPLINTFHNKCISVKASDVVGKGYRIELREGFEKNDTQFKLLEEFILKAPEKGRAFSQIINNWVVDRLTTGNGALEIARDAKKIPALLSHIPFYTLQVHKDNKKWCHIVDTERVWFKRFGVEENYYKKDGEEQDKFDMKTSAHELLLLQNYTSLSSYYGIPEIISAISAIMGNKFEADYNLQFFQNMAIPRYAIIVKGGKLSKELQRKIKEYFIREIKGNAHSTLFLEIPSTDPGMPNIEVEFKELDVREKEASFRFYRKGLMEEILVANGVPPYKVGLAVQGSLGGELGEELIDNYVSCEIEPLQTEIEDLLYLVTQEFAPNYMLRFNDLDIRNEKRLCEINTKYVEKSIMSINEARDDLGLVNVGEQGDKLGIFTQMGFMEVATVPVKGKSGKRENRLYERKLKQFKSKIGS